MNLTNTKQTILHGKWAMEPKYLYSLYDDVMRLSELRVGGLFSKVFGNPIVAGTTVDKVPTDAKEAEQVGDIAILNINGVMVKGATEFEQALLGYVNTDDISKAIDELKDDETVKQVVLNINSPGGEITGIPELARKVKELNTIKAVYAWTESKTQSAAYWSLGSQARLFGMTPSAEVGSIGVWTMHTEISEKLAKEGIKAKYIYSGTYKVLGNELEPLSQDGLDIYQKGINKAHDNFKQSVLSSRPNVKADAMEGLSYDGDDSLDNNLVDIVTDSFSNFLTTIAQ